MTYYAQKDLSENEESIRLFKPIMFEYNFKNKSELSFIHEQSAMITSQRIMLNITTFAHHMNSSWLQRILSKSPPILF